MTMSQPGQPEPGEGAIYEVEPPAPLPALPGGVVVRPDADRLIDAVAAELVVHAENCVRQFGDFHLALSGGAVFENLYARLMYDPDFRRLPWRRTHLWFVEERCVPLEHEASSFRMINELIGDHADIPPEQFHPILAGSATVVDDYEAQLREALAWRERGQDRLDYVLLAFDESGGAAALGGGSGTVDMDRLVFRAASADPAVPDRVSLTLSFVNAARFVAVLVSGRGSARTLQRSGGLPGAGPAGPVRALAPINGELRWYLDAAACRGLER